MKIKRTIVVFDAADLDAVSSFWARLLGGTVEAEDDWHMISVDGQPSVGMMGMPENMPPHVPSYWMPYFQVTDLDASTEKAKSLSGTVMVGPQNIPDGARFVILQDPQKAMFALYQPK